MESKECNTCVFFANMEDGDFCTLRERRAECYDFACDDYEDDEL